MAMTHDYLDLLDEKIAISPANSEEELQAAKVIAELMERHDVEASVEEFSAPVVSGLVSPLLAAASLTPAHIVKTTVFLTDLSAFAAVNEVYARLFESEPPARSCVEVSALPKGALVEIECVAAL